MPYFQYVAKDNSGKTHRGMMEYSDRSMLIEALRKKSLVIISIQETARKGAAQTSIKIKLDEIVVFSRQLATMVDSGIPLVQALDILHEQMDQPDMKKIIATVRDDIEVGMSFSEALLRHPSVFSSLYINMVKAGESSGALDEILDRLATYLEKASSLQKKVKSSLIYPAVVISMAIIITLIMLLKVIPTFKGIFETLGGNLPLPTQILINVSDALRQSFLYIVAVSVFVMFILKKAINTEKGRLIFDRLVLKLPIFGTLLRKVAIAKFTRTFATLVKSGVPVLVALDIVGKTAGNKIIENALSNVRNSIKEGAGIAEPLAKSGVFPPMVVRMISVGEQTGELEKMLSKIADFYDEQVDNAVDGMTKLIEPLIIAFLGIIIGGIVFAMFLPVFKLTEIIAH